MGLLTALLVLAATREASIEETREGGVAPLIELDETKQEEVRILEFVHGLPDGERAIFLKRLNDLRYSPPIIEAVYKPGDVAANTEPNDVVLEPTSSPALSHAHARTPWKSSSDLNCPFNSEPITDEHACKAATKALGGIYCQEDSWYKGESPVCRAVGNRVYFNSDAGENVTQMLCEDFIQCEVGDSSAQKRMLRTNRCARGPYVWDRSQYPDGMGSVFMQHRPSMILANILNASWVSSQLFDTHDLCDAAVDKGKTDQSAYFGLGSPECTDEDLALSMKRCASGFSFVDVREVFKHKEFQLEHLCSASVEEATVLQQELVKQLRACIPIGGSGARLVIVIPNKGRIDTWTHSDWLYCLFNRRGQFRQRFQYARNARHLVPRRPEDEVWITVHFRFGDTAKGQYAPSFVSTQHNQHSR
jgi:hypothetical protein